MVKQKIWCVLMALALLVNIAAWGSRSFSDFYVQHIFPVIGSAFSHVTAVFPFSVGEWMLVAAALFGLAFLAAGGLRLFVRKPWSRKLFAAFYRTFAWLFVIFFWIMTCDCFIQYHTTPFEELYLHPGQEGYTKTELAALRDYVVENVNALAAQMPRDAQGYVVYEGDLHRTSIRAVQALGAFYSLLEGYYPKPKEMAFSGLISQTNMMGYYFPFSMEANYNSHMYAVNKPATICHELSHLKGFLQEDEANLIGYLACVGSEDPFFQYSGYMSVLNYVERDFLDSIGRDAAEYGKHPAISELVYADDIFLTEEAWKKVEDNSIIRTETATKVSRAATTATLKLNGVSEGMESYEGVVKLLLDYYDGTLF